MMTTRNDATPAATWVAIDIAKRTHAVLLETPDGKHQLLSHPRAYRV